VGRLQNPPRLERQAVIVGGVEFVASVVHMRHLPLTGAVVHADLGSTSLALARTYNTNHFSLAPMVIVRLGIFLFAVCLSLDYQQIIRTQPFPGVEGPSKTARGPRRKEREGDNFVGRFGALRGDHLVQLEKDLRPNVQLGGAFDPAWRPGADVGRLGTEGPLLWQVVGGSTAARRRGSGRDRRVGVCRYALLGGGSISGIVRRVGIMGSVGDG
jgi:hypothetical protein